MKRGLFLLFGAVLLAAPVAADDASIQEDMRFIQELRKQGKGDLALEYLQRISKTASPELAKQLPLELAKARLEAAADEPDSGKRLGLYTEARDEFQKWLAANPTSPQAGEATLEFLLALASKRLRLEASDLAKLRDKFSQAMEHPIAKVLWRKIGTAQKDAQPGPTGE